MAIHLHSGQFTPKPAAEMSGEDKELIMLQIKSANKPLMRAIVGFGLGGMVSFMSAAFYLGGLYKEFKETQEWKTTASPKLEQHDRQIAVINDRLKIR